LSPKAWIKLHWLCHVGPTEVAAMGFIEDPRRLVISDLHLIDQEAGPYYVSLEDDSVADYFDRMVDAGHRPGQFARVWVHTHPGNSAMPSGTDEETFARVFGRCDWAIMFIMARGGQTYARLRLAAGPGGQMLIPIGVQWSESIGELDEEAWCDEYADSVRIMYPRPKVMRPLNQRIIEPSRNGRSGFNGHFSNQEHRNGELAYRR
jgi:proteasome lid subunit RPN8/RPN11